MRKKMVKIHTNLPKELNEHVDALVNAINSGKYPVDCETSQVLGCINMCESCRLIDSGFAKELRDYYVYDVGSGLYGQVL